jgi:hypothetical protein
MTKVDACIDERFNEFCVRLGHGATNSDRGLRIADWSAPLAINRQSEIRFPQFLSSSPCDGSAAKSRTTPWGLVKNARPQPRIEGSGKAKL